MIRRLVLLAGLWAVAVVPARATPLPLLPTPPCHCEWLEVNDPADDPIQTAAEVAADVLHEGDPAFVLVCLTGPVLPPLPPGPGGGPSPFGVPPAPPVDPPPVATTEAATGLLLLAGVAGLGLVRRR